MHISFLISVFGVEIFKAENKRKSTIFLPILERKPDSNLPPWKCIFVELMPPLFHGIELIGVSRNIFLKVAKTEARVNIINGYITSLIILYWKPFYLEHLGIQFHASKRL